MSNFQFQFTITVQACVLFTVTVDNGIITNVEYGDESLCAAFIGQHNLLSDADLSVFDAYLESALKIKESKGLMLSIDRRYGNGGSRIARVELVQSLIGTQVIFQRKYHATVIEEFKATDESELEYGLHWIKIRLDKGTIISLAKNAKTLDWIN
jgi:hypothetical protein